jgi:hypothetical protein
VQVLENEAEEEEKRVEVPEMYIRRLEKTRPN